MRKATHKEAADYLGLAVSTVGNLVNNKKKHAMLVGIATILDYEKDLKEKWRKELEKELEEAKEDKA